MNSVGDGFIEKAIQLQYSIDGITWKNTNWTLSPTYPYSKSASNKTYTFSGPAIKNVKGLRVVGQVRTFDMSYYWILKELVVRGSPSP